MNQQGILYGGDEIGALVFDPGHQSLRLGFAQVRKFNEFPSFLFGIVTKTTFFLNIQEDSPKSEIPSVVGVGSNGITDPEVKSDNNITSSEYFH